MITFVVFVCFQIKTRCTTQVYQYVFKDDALRDGVQILFKKQRYLFQTV